MQVGLTAMTDDAGRGPKKPRAGPVDVHIGRRIRLRRSAMRMTLGSLGEALGLSFQQVQKYERGANRVGSARLHDLSRALAVPVSYFFDGMAQKAADIEDTRDPGFIVRRETLDLVHAYDRIADAVVRKRVLDLIRALAPG